MRAPLALALLLAAAPALAESRRKTSVGGALGRTNAGIGAAVRDSGGPGSRGSSGRSSSSRPDWGGVVWGIAETLLRHRDQRPRTHSDSADGDSSSGDDATITYLPEERVEVVDHSSGHRSRFSGYIGVQKVHDSDGSGTIELSVTAYRFRLSGALSHYVEDQVDGGRTTLTLPSMMVGLRLTSRGNTQLFVDGGVSVAIPRGAPAMETSITAPTIGAQVVHYLNPKLALLADARAMWFEHDVTAVAGKVGIKFGHAQLSMRVLDFNVGPALWGPELGLAF